MLLRDGSTIQLPTLRLFCTSFPEPGIGQRSIRPARACLTKIPPRYHRPLTTFVHTRTKRAPRKLTCSTCAMNAEELLPGSRLIVRRRAYFHHGIYVGNGRVIHYAGWFRRTRGLVEEVTLEEFTEGHPYHLGRMPPDRRAGEDIVRRARSRLGERRYHLLRNNCEHFCNWCQLGECRSEQVEALMKPALVLTGIFQVLCRELVAGLLRWRGGIPKTARSFLFGSGQPSRFWGGGWIMGPPPRAPGGD